MNISGDSWRPRNERKEISQNGHRCFLDSPNILGGHCAAAVVVVVVAAVMVAVAVVTAVASRRAHCPRGHHHCQHYSCHHNSHDEGRWRPGVSVSQVYAEGPGGSGSHVSLIEGTQDMQYWEYWDIQYREYGDMQYWVYTEYGRPCRR